MELMIPRLVNMINFNRINLSVCVGIIHDFDPKTKFIPIPRIFRWYSIFHQRVSDVTGCNSGIDLFYLWPDKLRARVV